MKKIIFIIFLFISMASNANDPKQNISGQDITKNINQLLEKNKIPFVLGMLVSKASTGELIYKRNEDLLFVPASNLKLLTATAALLYLGPNFHYQTNLILNKMKINHGILNGDIYLKFSGDPDFTRDDLSNLIQGLKKYPINTIKGNLYIDDSVFVGDNIGPGWAWDDLNACYASPNLGLMIDKNCFDVKVTPAKIKDHIAILKIGNQAPYVIDNKITTSFTKKDCKIELKVLTNKQYQLTGCIFKDSAPQIISMAVKSPLEHAIITLKHLLAQNNIDLKGTIKISKTPKNMEILLQHQSKSMIELIKLMLKDSDNHIADSLSKTIGAIYTNLPGSWHNGTQAIKEILEKQTNINLSQAKIVDGSGLSFYNLITPVQLNQLLQFIYKSPIKPFIADALPIAGIDGTLKDRMLDEGIKGRVFGKTGTLNQVIALSGYAKSQNGQEYVFVILFNNFSATTDKIKHLENQLVEIIVNN